MHSELHGNVVHHGVELLLLVSKFFLLAIPKSLLILKDHEFIITNQLDHQMSAWHSIKSYIKYQLTRQVL